MRRLCASLHRRRGESTPPNPDPAFCLVSDICVRAPLTGGYHIGTQSRSRTFAQSRVFAKAVLTGCLPTITYNAKSFAVRSNAGGVAGKIAQCVGVRLPNTVRQLEIAEEHTDPGP